jgi:hypothetical protein
MTLLLTITLALPADQSELVEVRRIWDEGEHNAFTDLIRFDDRWLCTFREGQGHVSPDGALRVIASDDGEQWESIALITSETADLRDPKLCLTPDGRLMLTGAAAHNNPGDMPRHQTMAWFSDDGEAWDGPHPIGDRGFWLWRVTWHDGVPYSVGYSTGADRTARVARLYRGVDGPIGSRRWSRPCSKAASRARPPSGSCPMARPSACSAGTGRGRRRSWADRPRRSPTGPGPTWGSASAGRTSSDCPTTA